MLASVIVGGGLEGLAFSTACIDLELLKLGDCPRG